MTCKVNGCPLKAEFVTDYFDNGRPKWGMCRYHRMVTSDDWKTVTARLEEYAPVIKLFRDIDELTDPIFLPLPGEDVPTWLDRVNDNLRRVITGTYHNQVDGEANFAQLYQTLGQPIMRKPK